MENNYIIWFSIFVSLVRLGFWVWDSGLTICVETVDDVDIDNVQHVHIDHQIEAPWPLLQHKYSRHPRVPSSPMTSDPSRSQIRNSISGTLFGHLTDADWALTFLSLVAFLRWSCVCFCSRKILKCGSFGKGDWVHWIMRRMLRVFVLSHN